MNNEFQSIIGKLLSLVTAVILPFILLSTLLYFSRIAGLRILVVDIAILVTSILSMGLPLYYFSKNLKYKLVIFFILALILIYPLFVYTFLFLCSVFGHCI